MSQRNGSTGEADTPGALWGRQLKRARMARGITQTKLASDLGFSRSTLAMYEAGKDVPQRSVAVQCDLLLDTGTALADMWDDTNWYPVAVLHPDWFERRAKMDAQLTHLCEYETHMIPGLLQTEAYARALFRQVDSDSEDRVTERVQARLSRQDRFHRPNGPLYVVLLKESCIRQVVGGAAVMREQLDLLLELGALPNIHIQLIPFTFHHVVSPTHSMSLITLPDGGRWVYSEYLDGGHLSADPAGLSRHQRRYDRVRADAPSPRESAALIAEAREGYDHDEHVRPERGALAQEQLQRRQRRQLHRSGPRIHPGHRPRA